MRKILLVDDDESFRGILKNILSKKYQVIEAPDGRAARNVHQLDSTVDLIISDIQMPHLSGVEFLEWVKQNKPVPFILTTGFSHILEIQQAHEIGADEFLPKPFKEEDLLEKLVRFLGEEKEPVALKPSSWDLDKESPSKKTRRGLSFALQIAAREFLKKTKKKYFSRFSPPNRSEKGRGWDLVFLWI